MCANTRGEVYANFAADDALLSNSKLRSELFQVDTILTPIIAVLNRKGYRTRACCGGHLSTHFIGNVVGCLTNLEQYEPIEDFQIHLPYIMFDDNIEFQPHGADSTIPEIPSYWTVEVNTPRSDSIPPDAEDGLLKIHKEYDDGDYVIFRNPIPFDELNTNEGGFNIILRANIPAVNNSDNIEDAIETISMNPYKAFYYHIAKACSQLYDWVCQLPEYKGNG